MHPKKLLISQLLSPTFTSNAHNNLKDLCKKCFWSYNKFFLFNSASNSLLKHSFTYQNKTFLLNCVIFLVSSKYWFSLRKPCSHDSVFTPLISSNRGRWGWYKQFGLSGGMHTSSVCLVTWKMSTRNCTFSSSSFAPALPFFAWFFRNGTRPHALSYPKYFSLLKSSISRQNVLRIKRNTCVYDSLVNISVIPTTIPQGRMSASMPAVVW